MLAPTLIPHPHEQRRREWLAGRRAATQAIAEHCTVSLAKVRVVGGREAAPVAQLRVDGGWKTLPVSISISHHDGYALAAVVDCPARVGVDLARIGEIEPEHYRYFLAQSEFAVAERIGATAVWALKEAAWKALALSPETPFSALEITIDEADELHGLRLDGSHLRAIGHTWLFDAELVAAVVCVGDEIA